MFVFWKERIESLEAISCAYHTMWGQFKNFIQVIRKSVIGKNVGYSIYALIKTFCW